MLKIFKLKSEFFRNVLTLLTGTTIAQVIPIAATPILTRLYTPEEFGILAIYISISTILLMVATGQYERAIILPKNDQDSVNLFALSSGLSVIFSVLLLVLIVIFKNPILQILKAEELSNFLYLIPLSVLILGVYQSSIYWYNRRKNFKKIAGAKIIQSSSVVGVQIPAGFYSTGVFGLISGIIVGQILSCCYMFKNILNQIRKNISSITLKEIKRLAKEHKEFPVFSMPGSVMNKTSVNIPIILLSSFFNTTVAGLYSLSNRLITTPMGLVTYSVSQVFYQEAASRYNQSKDLAQLVKSTYKKLFLIAVVPFVILLLFAPQIFAVIFGENWRSAGDYTRFLIPWLFLVFMNSPITTLIYILKKQKLFLFFEIVLLSSRVMALFLGFVVFANPYISVGLYSTVGFLYNLFLVFYFFRISKTSQQISSQ